MNQNITATRHDILECDLVISQARTYIYKSMSFFYCQ